LIGGLWIFDWRSIGLICGSMDPQLANRPSTVNKILNRQ
jgi:hypothetical protein